MLKSTLLILVILSFVTLEVRSAEAEPEIIDTLGAITQLNEKHVKRSARLVRQGKVVSLALETTPTTPAYQPRQYDINISKTDAFGANQTNFIDDQVITHNGIGTQIDGFAHAGINFVHYNGITTDEIFDEKGIKKFSTSEIPPIVTRGVLLNMAAYFEKEMLSEGISYSVKDIKGALQAQGVKLRKGDVVIFHSGWNKLLGADDTRWISAHPGLGKEGAEFLAKKGVVAVGADTAAVEVIPFENLQEVFPVHQILLAKHGVYILEALNTDPLVEAGVSTFMFVLGIPRLAGSVQSIINPVAIY